MQDPTAVITAVDVKFSEAMSSRPRTWRDFSFLISCATSGSCSSRDKSAWNITLSIECMAEKAAHGGEKCVVRGPTAFAGTAPEAVHSSMPTPRHEPHETCVPLHLKALFRSISPLDAMRRTFRSRSRRGTGDVQRAPRILARQRDLTPRDNRTHGREGHRGTCIAAEHTRRICSGRRREFEFCPPWAKPSWHDNHPDPRDGSHPPDGWMDGSSRS